ncbi:MAG: helix-turn-helix transcriptional regulator [Bacteroidota bacterium]
MIYEQLEPNPILRQTIKSFWLVDSLDDDKKFIQKIIPDGYPELIFHYKSPFKANISGEWFLQDKDLIAGQIRNHFFLENTGTIGMFGIKFQPWTLKLLFDLNMHPLTDQVIPFHSANLSVLNPLKEIAIGQRSFKSKVEEIEDWFINSLDLKLNNESKGQIATQYLIDKKGAVSIQDVVNFSGISERSLERYFKNHIGLTPKFYCRILRFANVFKLVQADGFNWTDIAYFAGFYDQSHFIKNFKEFTGEEPSNYGFDAQNMANFFLK